MSGLFQALEIGKRALLTHQFSLNTVGHNIANVNTPGYTRQRVEISASNPSYTTQGAVGTGIQVNDVIQIRDYFLGGQFRDATKAAGKWQYRQKTLSNIEGLFNEPNDDSLADQLNGLWDSFSELSTDATSVTARKNVVAQANLVVNSFNQLAQRLYDQREALNADINTKTLEVNRLTTEIGRLNGLIGRHEAGGSTANDLRDSRDQLIDELSVLVDVNTVEKPNGMNMVQIGSMILVDGADSFDVGTRRTTVDGRVTDEFVWEGTKVKLINNNGELAGLIDARDKTIPEYLDKLDEMARTLVEEVNAIHRNGYGLDGSTGVNFFDPANVTAATIRLNSAIEGDGADRIAASGSATGIGDNSIALALSGLRSAQVAGNGTMSINDYYNSLVGKLGVETKEAISFSANYELMIQQVDNARQAVQGVSLDEEMTNMVKYQHAYEAAARIITAMDQALDTVISGMGIVGR
jgi:flagellar hook-associated protein 1 FlgK